MDVSQYAYRNWDNANWAKWTSLTLGSRISGLADTNRRIYFRFDPTPLGMAVKSGARVLLQLTSAKSSTGAGEVQLFRVTTPWQAGAATYHSGQVEPNAAPGEISWNSQPTVDFSTPIASLPIQPGAHVYAFDSMPSTSPSWYAAGSAGNMRMTAWFWSAGTRAEVVARFRSSC